MPCAHSEPPHPACVSPGPLGAAPPPCSVPVPGYGEQTPTQARGGKMKPVAGTPSGSRTAQSHGRAGGGVSEHRCHRPAGPRVRRQLPCPAQPSSRPAWRGPRGRRSRTTKQHSGVSASGQKTPRHTVRRNLQARPLVNTQCGGWGRGRATLGRPLVISPSGATAAAGTATCARPQGACRGAGQSPFLCGTQGTSVGGTVLDHRRPHVTRTPPTAQPAGLASTPP